MQIIKKETTNYNINNLEIGDLFLYGNSVYMKVERLDYEEVDSYNAISLENPCGVHAHFYEDEEIIPLDATLTVQKKRLTMEIYDSRQQTNATFDELKQGDCFYCNGSLFMVLDSDPGNYNTICFNDNRLYYFFEKDKIEKVRIKITITVYPIS